MSAPYSLLMMDPEAAQRIAEAGASLLLLDVPQGSYLGIDHQGFTVGPRFKGVKMVPPGPHFISYRAVDAQGECSFTTGFYVHPKHQEVVVRRWDVETETLVALTDEDEASRLAAGVRRFEFDSFLAPYNLHSYAAWCQLSRHLTADIIHKLSPVGGSISITAEADDPELQAPKTDGERRLVKQLQEGRAKRMRKQQLVQVRQAAAAAAPQPLAHATVMEVDSAQGDDGASAGQGGGTSAAAGSGQGGAADERDTQMRDTLGSTGRTAEEAAPAIRWGRCFYSRLPRLVKSAGISAAELTALNMDKSALLERVVTERYSGSFDALLGELQFAFIAFVFGQSLDGFNQWKSLLLLLLGCEDAAVRTRSAFFADVLRALTAQLSTTVSRQTEGQPPALGQAHGDGGAAIGVPLIEELLPDSFLKRAFGGFFSGVRECGAEVPADVAMEAVRLKQLLAQALGWEYDAGVGEAAGQGAEDEDDEYAPQVVEL